MYTISSDIMAAELDNEVVILDLTSGEYYGLNPTAASIWQSIVVNNEKIEDVIEKLAGSDHMLIDEVRSDIHELISVLLEYGFITQNLYEIGE